MFDSVLGSFAITSDNVTYLKEFPDLGLRAVLTLVSRVAPALGRTFDDRLPGFFVFGIQIPPN